MDRHKIRKVKIKTYSKKTQKKQIYKVLRHNSLKIRIHQVPTCSICNKI